MPTIYIDKKPYEVPEGQNLLQACLGLGFNLPFFCWHPAMGSVGACRQCAIKQFKDENDTKGRIVMACMTPAAENTYISIYDPDAVEFRASVIEWLMVNHPHDCPVCDEGGECHLQDMTVMTGHAYRRYRGPKRTFHNQDLGPFITHQMNRCIQCYRCVRYYRDYAGGNDLNAYSMHDTVFFGRERDGVLESEFSGNLVEVCPTGVFTDKTLKEHYVRKWDIQSAPSICVNCSVGCNTLPGERLGLMRRIRSRYNGDVNGYFLCDRGRYGYEFVNSGQRLYQVRLPGGVVPKNRQEVVQQVGALLADGKRLMGIGSPQASLESNYALRTLVGAENFYQGISEHEHQLQSKILQFLQAGFAHSPSLHEIGECDAVLVLGEDVSNTAPMIALALRQSVRQQPKRQAEKLRIAPWDDYSTRLVIQDKKGPFYNATFTSTRIDEIARQNFRGTPDDIARLGFAVAHELDGNAPEVKDLTDRQRSLAQVVAQALKQAERPLVLSGTGAGSGAILQAAANVALALKQAGKQPNLSFVVPESNSMGLGLMGGNSLEAALQVAQTNPPDILIILENDLGRRVTSEKANALFEAARQVIVLDVLDNPTASRADVVLPATSFAEGSGSLVNQEGRIQRFYQVFAPKQEIQESWRWIKEIFIAMGRPEGAQWENLDKLQAALVAELPVFQPLLEVAPPASFRIAGAKIPRQPARWSGRTANYANISVHLIPTPPPDPDSPLDFSMEGANVQPPPALIPRFWAPGWNSYQSFVKYEKWVPGPLKGGNPGCRLFEVKEDAPANYGTDIPDAFKQRPNEWLLVPLYHIYGSEPLSMLTPGVAMLAPQPYVAVNLEDAAALKGVALEIPEPGKVSSSGALVNEAENFEVVVGGKTYLLPARFDNSLPRGVLGLPVGLPGMPVIDLPDSGQLHQASAAGGAGNAAEGPVTP